MAAGLRSASLSVCWITTSPLLLLLRFSLNRSSPLSGHLLPEDPRQYTLDIRIDTRIFALQENKHLLGSELVFVAFNEGLAARIGNNSSGANGLCLGFISLSLLRNSHFP